MELLDRDEEVLRRSEFGNGAGERADGVDQFCRGIGGAALLAGVAILVCPAALRAGAFDESVGEEDACFGIVELLHVTGNDQVAGS